MKILLTGASSFTGMWFARRLAEAAHELVLPLPRAQTEYHESPRAERVRQLARIATPIWNMRFGDDAFLALVREQAFDILAHHAAQVGDHRAADFDVLAAVAANTLRIDAVLDAMRARGLRGVIATASVFEPDTGAGETPLRAVSAYGLSKGLSGQIIRHHCLTRGIDLLRFVLPNPFGAFEEPRFCTHLVRCWQRGETAEVRTPLYVRDNLPVTLAADRYVAAIAALATGNAPADIAPSGYVESQAHFAERLARELGPRLGVPTPLHLCTQTDFAEPMTRVNTEPMIAEADPAALTRFWDEHAAFYAT
jgi:nucleoside-diphosphate-sugar epimerase